MKRGFSISIDALNKFGDLKVPGFGGRKNLNLEEGKHGHALVGTWVAGEIVSSVVAHEIAIHAYRFLPDTKEVNIETPVDWQVVDLFNENKRIFDAFAEDLGMQHAGPDYDRDYLFPGDHNQTLKNLEYKLPKLPDLE